MIRRSLRGLAGRCAPVLAAAALAPLLAVAAAPTQGPAAAAALAPLQPGLDYHSFANVEQFRVTRLELDLRIDPSFKTVSGTVGLHVKRLDPNATELILDTRDLDIMDVTERAQGVLGATSKDETTWVARAFHLERKDPILGQALVIELPPAKLASHFIKIDYETSPTAAALQWLSTPLAAGRHRDFFYTQSRPIGARSWIPLQDTPQARVTYAATVHTFSNQSVVMTGKNNPKARRNGEFSVVMTDPIPPYLIALAMGDLEFKETGPRTGVYAGKSLLKAAAAEFADAESMIEASEKLLGPYRWERYDILVMPASFPVGSMAHPRLSFITPTAIAGDKSLAGVIAEDLAHSWAGSLVTTATWRDSWLTEAFCAYLESRMVNAVYGERREMMERVLGLRSLREELAKLPAADQTLARDLRGRDPGDIFSQVPYEKGRLFLTFLDAKFGRERFDAFLRGYFDHFAFQSITTEQFLAYLEQNLILRFPGIVTAQQITVWVNAPGLPAEAVLPVSDAFAPVDETRSRWTAGAVTAKKLDTRDWALQQWLYFLDGMPAVLTAAQMGELDQAFGFSRSPNAELAQGWFLLVIRHQYQPSYVRLEDYLKTIGRRKLIVPLYEELMKTPAGAVQAKRVYAAARAGYHPQTAALLDGIVDTAAESTDE